MTCPRCGSRTLNHYGEDTCPICGWVDYSHAIQPERRAEHRQMTEDAQLGFKWLLDAGHMWREGEKV